MAKEMYEDTMKNKKFVEKGGIAEKKRKLDNNSAEGLMLPAKKNSKFIQSSGALLPFDFD